MAGAGFTFTGDTFHAYVCDTFGRHMRKAAARRGWEALDASEQARVDAARADINEFVEYCFRDERGRPIVQQAFHRAWQHDVLHHRRLIIEASVEHAKTKQLSVFRTLWILGHNHNALIALISETAQGKAYKTLAEIQENITSNVRLHRVFPELRRGRYWRQNECAVERDIVTRDPSIQALGLFGPVNGARLTHIIVDDLLSFENTYSTARRKKTLEWIEQEVLSRLLADAEAGEDGDVIHGDSFLMTATSWHRDDAMQALKARKRFVSRKYPAIRAPVSELRDPAPDTETKILWPAAWPLQRLRDRLDDVGSVAFARQMLCEVRDEESAYFKASWIERSQSLGRGKPMLSRYAPSKDERIVVGVDLATGKDVATHDLNAISVLLYSGTDRSYRLLWIESDYDRRWTPQELIAKIDDMDGRYLRPEFRVESNFGQVYLAQFAEHATRARIVPTFTGRDKRDPKHGVQGIAVWMERGAFALPAHSDGTIDREVERLVEEMLSWEPQDRHIPDLLASLWMAFAGHERGRVPSDWLPQAKKRQLRRLEF